MDVKGVTSVPIVGARSIEQLDENVGSLDVSLSDDQNERITRAGRGEGVGV